MHSKWLITPGIISARLKPDLVSRALTHARNMMWSSKPKFLIRMRTKNLAHNRATITGNGVQKIASRAGALFWSPSGGGGRACISKTVAFDVYRTTASLEI